MTARVEPARGAWAGALPVWLASRVAVLLAGLMAVRFIGRHPGRETPSLAEAWQHWDVDIYRKVAEHGYFSPAYGDRTEAFFPGMPSALRAVHYVVPDWTIAGLVVSFLAGGFACVSLYRLGLMEGLGDEVARRAVLYLVLFPFAVFLFAGYSEALFLCFAVSAWEAARRNSWVAAGLFGAAVSATRVTGVFVVAGLAVMYLTTRPWRKWASWEALMLVVAVVPLVAYVSFLKAKTGHWDAYQRALREHWGRDTVNPLDAFANTWRLAGDTGIATTNLWNFRMELAAVVLGVVLTVVLLVLRRWPEATYVGLNSALLSVSSFYGSAVRGALVWFPLYLLLARWSVRRQWLHGAIVWTWGPAMVVLVVAFVLGSWLG